MKLNRNIRRLGATLLTIALSTSAGGVRADQFADWAAGKISPLQPRIEYEGPEIEIKFSHPAPPASIVPPAWQEALDWFNGLTDGKVVIKQYGSGTLHGARDGFKAVRSGITDFATCYSSFEGRGFELTRAFRLPLVTSGNALLDARIMAELAEEFFVPEFERADVIYAATQVLGTYDIMSHKPVTTLKQIEGMKIIAQGLEPDMAAALGFVNLNIPYPEIYTALQQGVADAVIWADGGFVPFKVSELAKNLTNLDLYVGYIDMCYSSRTLEKLPPQLREPFVMFQQRMAGLVTQRISHDFASRAREIYAQNNVEHHELEAGEHERIRQAITPVLNRWAEEVEELGKPARALLSRIDMLKKKHATAGNAELQTLILGSPVARSFSN